MRMRIRVTMGVAALILVPSLSAAQAGFVAAGVGVVTEPQGYSPDRDLMFEFDSGLCAPNTCFVTLEALTG